MNFVVENDLNRPKVVQIALKRAQKKFKNQDSIFTNLNIT